MKNATNKTAETLPCSRCGAACKGVHNNPNWYLCRDCGHSWKDEGTLEDQLERLGLRIAKPGEAGWYVLVTVDGTEKKVWATDDPPEGFEEIEEEIDFDAAGREHYGDAEWERMEAEKAAMRETDDHA